ncbi:uncharacterized protein KQ657_000234 [Scheffersomyces spartinae]|uniref:YCII-related domain-containing protein n=1 Tax=Scheffersomyces spartinae TaxID=45513 RepID=A0A9P7VDZ7_9ASCO|nr:uncharacterized protein KQ657_000234 [Scheffersomyces spartinae]KAG7196221.1 hypothetical protein KQ657_000234 [Scheffersomyces spartinae]
MGEKIEWNVIIYDKPNTDRTGVRPQHMADIPSAVNSGIVKLAGAIYKDASKTQFAGSAFHLMAENESEIIEFLKKDIYYREGIWDIDNVIINPIGVAIRSTKYMNGTDESLYKI